MRCFTEAELAAHIRSQQETPIDMVLHCPACGLQHIDREEPPEFAPPEFREATAIGASQVGELNPGRWRNPPHRSHLCAACGNTWRPADVPTNGVQAIKTKGEKDGPRLKRQEG